MDSYQQVIIWRERLAAAEKASRDGNRAKAEGLYKQSLDMSQRLSDQEHVTSLIHLADFYSAGKEFGNAEPLYRQAAGIYERTFGPHNIIGAICLRSLSEVLDALGKTSEAESIRTKAMQILAAMH